MPWPTPTSSPRSSGVDRLWPFLALVAVGALIWGAAVGLSWAGLSDFAVVGVYLTVGAGIGVGLRARHFASHRVLSDLGILTAGALVFITSAATGMLTLTGGHAWSAAAGYIGAAAAVIVMGLLISRALRQPGPARRP